MGQVMPSEHHVKPCLHTVNRGYCYVMINSSIGQLFQTVLSNITQSGKLPLAFQGVMIMIMILFLLGELVPKSMQVKTTLTSGLFSTLTYTGGGNTKQDQAKRSDQSFIYQQNISQTEQGTTCR